MERWNYRITNKELWKITETKLLEDFRQQQQKWVTNLTPRENKDIIQILIFHAKEEVPINTGKNDNSYLS